MSRQVRLSREAVAELAAIRRWYRQPGAGLVAKRRAATIARAIQRLMVQPCLWPCGDTAGTRELNVAGHCIVYEVVPDTGRDATSGDVLVLRVFGPGQSRAGYLAPVDPTP